MNDQDTWIEPPVYQQPPETPSEPPLPPMPPPPPPPGSEGRNWLVIGVIIGVVILVLCVVAGYVGYQVYLGDGFSFTGDQQTGQAEAFLTQTALAQEISDTILITDTPSPEPTIELPPTDPPPTDTEAPIESPTDTQIPTPSVPIFTANQALFCRAGPSSIYQEVRTMNGGDAQPILGQSTSPVDGVSIWWQVEIDGRRCYVSSTLGKVEGDTSGVQVLAAPPTPTPTPTLTPTPTATATP